MNNNCKVLNVGIGRAGSGERLTAPGRKQVKSARLYCSVVCEMSGSNCTASPVPVLFSQGPRAADALTLYALGSQSSLRLGGVSLSQRASDTGVQ